MKLPFQIDLKGKTAVVTGAGGVLCSEFAKAIAKTGACVAVLDLNFEAAKKVEGLQKAQMIVSYVQELASVAHGIEETVKRRTQNAKDIDKVISVKNQMGVEVLNKTFNTTLK